MFGEGFDDPLQMGGAGRFIKNIEPRTERGIGTILENEERGIIPRCVSELFK
jgi:hypothetical protein